MGGCAGGQGRARAGLRAALSGERAVRSQREGAAPRPGAARGERAGRQGAARAPGHQHTLALWRQDHPEGTSPLLMSRLVIPGWALTKNGTVPHVPCERANAPHGKQLQVLDFGPVPPSRR